MKKNFSRKKQIKKPILKNTVKKKNVETSENLLSLLNEYEKNFKYFNSHLLRLSDLLSRQSAKKMTELKYKKMQKQLEIAKEEYSFARIAIDQITFRISQLPEDQK